MRKYVLTFLTSILFSLCMINTVFANFNLNEFQDENYVIQIDDMDDTGTIYWKQFEKADMIKITDSNSQTKFLGQNVFLYISENGDATLRFNVFCSPDINATKMIIMTDCHRFTFDVSQGWTHTAEGYEQYTVIIKDEQYLQLLLDIGKDTKPEKIRLSGSQTVNGKMSILNEMRAGYAAFANDYVKAKGLEQDLSLYIDTLIEMKNVEPWEWEERVVEQITPTSTPNPTPTPTSKPVTKSSNSYSPEKTYGYDKSDPYMSAQDTDGDGRITEEQWNYAFANAVEDAMEEYGVDSFDELMDAMAENN